MSFQGSARCSTCECLLSAVGRHAAQSQTAQQQQGSDPATSVQHSKHDHDELYIDDQQAHIGIDVDKGSTYHACKQATADACVFV